MTVDLDELERLARRAKLADEARGSSAAFDYRGARDAFIAVAQPGVILELVERVRRAEDSDRESVEMYRRARDRAEKAEATAARRLEMLRLVCRHYYNEMVEACLFCVVDEVEEDHAPNCPLATELQSKS